MTTETYESASKKLEQIAIQLENGEVSLDKAIELFEKGVELSKFCLEKIKQGNGKITLLKKQLDEIFEAPFDTTKKG